MVDSVQATGPVHSCGHRAGCGLAAIKAALLAWALSCCTATAAELWLVTDEPAAHAGAAGHHEFIDHLRLLHARQAGTGERVRVLSSTALEQAFGPAPDAPLAGVRTRSAAPAMPQAGSRQPALAPSPARQDAVVIAMGLPAARAMLESPHDSAPLLLTLLTRGDYELLRQHPRLQRPTRPMAVLLSDADVVLQYTLAQLVLPQLGTMAVVATNDLEPVVQELLSAMPHADIVVGYASEATHLNDAMQEVLPGADALLLLADQFAGDRKASISLLHAAAQLRKPAFGTSQASVLAGALAAAAPSQQQLAAQALQLSKELAQQPDRASSQQPYPMLLAQPDAVQVYTNPLVAQRLGVALPSAEVLQQGLQQMRH